MLKNMTKPYLFVIIALGLAACDAYIDNTPVTTESQGMQQRQTGFNSSRAAGGRNLPKGAGPDESRMQQMRAQSSISTAGPSLSSSSTAGPSTASPLAPGGVIGPRNATQQQAITEPPLTTGNHSSQAQASPSQKPVNKQSLSKGLQLYEQKDFTAAAQEFESFIKENDGADDIPEALYYLGNSYFELENWDKAALAYKQVDRNYYLYPLAPQASLKLAQCYEKLGQSKLADAIRKNMKDKYAPGSY